MFRSMNFGNRFHEICSELDRLDSLFDQTYRETTVKIELDKDSANVYTELPGVEKENIKVGIKSGKLVIEANKKLQDEKFSFKKELEVDDSLDTTKLSAKFKNGVLHIKIPLKEQNKKDNREVQIE